MRLEHLTARSFRNLAPTALAFSSTVNLFIGANGEGKTNLLEAIYLCATGRSFRQAPPSELLQFGCDEGRLSATLRREQVRHEVKIGITSRARLLRVDERPVRRLSTLLELINMVSFFPEDLQIAKGAPEGRRRFFDRAVLSLSPAFLAIAVDYQKVLKSRNALLRSSQGVDRRVLKSFDLSLARLGALLHHAREEALGILAPLAAMSFRRLCLDKALELRLDNGLEIPTVLGESDYEGAFLQKLSTSFARDRARGSTSVGPHRSDLICLMDGRDMRRYASQGQQRALVLSLKISELRAATERLGSPPLLLLDDVSSELDKARTGRLFDEVAQIGCQTFVTSTGSTKLPLTEDMSTFNIAQGAAELVQSDAFRG